MTRILAFWRSTPGKKAVMGATGLVMLAWLVLHMMGNLQAFGGAAKLNGYAGLLHGPAHELLLLGRAVLLICALLHVVAAVQVTLRDRAARPVGYARKESQAATVASRTMVVGGLGLLAFVVLHLLHFTTGRLHPDFVEGDVYRNVITGLGRPGVAGLYLVAMAVLGLHLYHGAWSGLRSLGAAAPRANPLERPVAGAVAAVLWLGFSLVPVAVLLGWLS